jgi:hypothetical protein
VQCRTYVSPTRRSPSRGGSSSWCACGNCDSSVCLMAPYCLRLEDLACLVRSARLTAWRACSQLACASCDDAIVALQGNIMPLLCCRARCCDAGQPPPRLLAPHVIHCRGIATALAGTVCDDSTAKKQHMQQHMILKWFYNGCVMLLPCPCHVIAMIVP